MAHILPPIKTGPTWHGIPRPEFAPLPLPEPLPEPEPRTLPASVQVAILRARMLARSNVRRAVDILRAIGATMAQAARYLAQFRAVPV